MDVAEPVQTEWASTIVFVPEKHDFAFVSFTSSSTQWKSRVCTQYRTWLSYWQALRRSDIFGIGH